MASALDWIEYLPRGLRRAWCEVSGGHDNTILGAGRAGKSARHIALRCSRCAKQTRWYEVPTVGYPSEPGA